MTLMAPTPLTENKIKRFFISYTAKDLSPYANVVVDVLRKFELVAIDHRDSGSTGEPSVQWCLKQVDRCDALIVLVAHRYGWVPNIEQGGDGKTSITELEVQRALEQEKTVLSYIVRDDHPWIPRMMEHNKREEISSFKDKLSRFISSSITTPESLDGAVSRDIAKTLNQATNDSTLSIELSGNIDEFGEQETKEFLNRIDSKLKSVDKGKTLIVKIRKGSIIVTFVGQKEILEKIEDAVEAGDLARLNITKIREPVSPIATADLSWANLKGANLRDVHLYRANLIRANLKGANLTGTNLREANLRGANLRGANLRGANLIGSDLIKANLVKADLKGADLKGADLKGADLKEADLKEADLKEADLKGANLKGADLKGADLRGAYLRGAYLRGAYLGGTDLRADTPKRRFWVIVLIWAMIIILIWNFLKS